MQQPIQISLPWPSRDLSPNNNINHFRKAAARRNYKNTCMWECKAQKIQPIKAERLKATFVFHPPVTRRHDKDNLIARMKAGIDGVSQIVEIDDHFWDYGEPVLAGPVKHGRVDVTLEPIDNWQHISDVAKGMVRGEIG